MNDKETTPKLIIISTYPGNKSTTRVNINLYFKNKKEFLDLKSLLLLLFMHFLILFHISTPLIHWSLQFHPCRLHKLPCFIIKQQNKLKIIQIASFLHIASLQTPKHHFLSLKLPLIQVSMVSHRSCRFWIHLFLFWDTVLLLMHEPWYFHQSVSSYHLRTSLHHQLMT